MTCFKISNVYYKHKLLNHSWELAMQTHDADGLSPMKKLIEVLPAAALQVLDQCVTKSHEDNTDPDLSVGKTDLCYSQSIGHIINPVEHNDKNKTFLCLMDKRTERFLVSFDFLTFWFW